jgi:predicted Zn-dependent peptidase
MAPHPIRPSRALCLALLPFLCLAALPAAARDLHPHIEQLPNGLTVMILEDHAQPLVSTQMVYRVGGRTENAGETGLAHFVEHMAYRASENFPDTDVVSRIYAAGGEWHGYTWIDETAFFATVPADRLDLLLAIEADRMARLLIPAAEMEAERGAVLTELHSYENDPASRLNDAVIAASFVEHPYRNNVIGWETDVQRISRDDIVAFYRLHYVPANAVLAVVGDVDGARAMELIHQHFDGIPSGARTPLPRSIEPPQLGERRVELQGGGKQSWFQISYRAPAASDPDYPAFLLLQAVLSGSDGASFRQDEEPIAARPGTRLHDAGEGVHEVRSFLAPTALPYIFSLSGSADAAAQTARVEEGIEKRIADLRDHPVPAAELATARRSLLDALMLDDETTEDAAHQMSYFAAIGAFPVLRRLPELVAAVTAEDLQRVAAGRLQPWQRTIGWVHPGAPLAAAQIPVLTAPPSPPSVEPGIGKTTPEDRLPAVRKLRNGVGLIARRLSRVPGGVLRVVVPGNSLSFGEAVAAEPDEPSWRHTSITVRFRAGDLARAVETARKALLTAKPTPPLDVGGMADVEDPEARLRLALRDLLGAVPAPPPGGPLTPAVIVAVGDFDETAALRLLEKAFEKLPARRSLPPAPLQVQKTAETIALPGMAQSEIGYAVPAAASPPSDALAWRLLLYIMSHGYEGRLGKDLIARRGLLYFIDSRYDADGRSAWISLVTGVNPDKLEAARARFAELMDQLRQEPPTAAEVEEAKQHLIGRRATAPMSDEEISAAYAREWIEEGRLLDDTEFARRVRAVTRDRVLALVPRFLAGATAVVDVADPHPQPP